MHTFRHYLVLFTALLRNTTRVKHARIAILAIKFLLIILCIIKIPPGGTSFAHTFQLSPATQAQPAGVSDPEELEAFLDRFMAEKMQELEVPNASFVLVKDGEIFLSKGYGYADYARETPVDPEKHLFRIASVSKTFVATAIMQLAEQGKLNLNDDVNTYLTDFQLEDLGAEPVTIAHILTHSGGLDDRIYNSYTESPDMLMPFELWLPLNRPYRATPPGLVARYSNSGYNLLGYIVQQVSGNQFSAYVEDHIFTPLAMQRSSFEQVLSPSLAADLARRYAYVDGAFQPVAPIYLNEIPAGGMYSTATDMAAYMIAHLQNGRYGDTRILNAASVQAMQQQQFSMHPQLPGFGYGFYQGIQNGQQLLLHDGDGPAIHARMLLLPETKTGFFIVQGGGSARLRADLTQALLDQYYPYENGLPQSIENQHELARFAGFYRLNRYDHTGILKIPTGLMSIQITAEQDQLAFKDPFGSGTLTWVEIEPLLFQSSDGRFLMAFKEDAQGRISDMSVRLYQLPLDLERIAWYESMGVLLASLLGPSLLFLSAIVGWPLVALIRRIRKRPLPPRPAQYARWTAAVVAVCGIFLMANLLIEDFIFGSVNPFVNPLPLIISLLIIHLGLLLALTLPYFTWRAWRGRYWNMVSRIHYTLITAGALIYVLVAAYGNILGFNI